MGSKHLKRLAAQIIDRAANGIAWRIAESPSRLQPMVDQIAYRVASELILNGSSGYSPDVVLVINRRHQKKCSVAKDSSGYAG